VKQQENTGDDSMKDDADRVGCEEDQKQNEIVVVAEAHAVVYEGAVVVEALNTPIANVAMSRFFGFQILALNADIVQVYRFFQHAL
jgi:hypothetical protein